MMSNTLLPTSSPGIIDDWVSRRLINMSRNEKEAVKASWTRRDNKTTTVRDWDSFGCRVERGIFGQR